MLAYTENVEKVRKALPARMENLILFYEAMEHEALGALKVDEKSVMLKVKLGSASRALAMLMAIKNNVATAAADFSRLPDRVRVETINIMVPIIDKTLTGMESFKSVYELFNPARK